MCQVENRVPGSPGKFPCPELAIHGGVWQFDANKIGQMQADGKRYATGIRSLVAMDWNFEDGNLFAIQHGRDDFFRTWPDLYSAWQSALLPSEEFFRVTEGTNGGWPYYYFDQMQNKKVLNPEYGGDGKKNDGADTVAMPLIGFPGHFAPNDLLFYKGDQFPARYKNGAFVAFHGSTIRAPYPQAGYIRGLCSIQQWKTFRALGSICRRIRTTGYDRKYLRREGTSHGTCNGTGWFIVYHRKCKGKDMESHVQG